MVALRCQIGAVVEGGKLNITEEDWNRATIHPWGKQ